jgi:hypothetical protein
MARLDQSIGPAIINGEAYAIIAVALAEASVNFPVVLQYNLPVAKVGYKRF